jgi:hypothetical protein
MHPLTTLILITLLNLPVVAYGAEYKALVGIPGVTDPNADFSSYINSLYVLSISVAALLAVIKIVIAGMKYMLSDIVTNKAEAKKDIEGAIIGLLVVLAAVLILTVINPKITNTAITFEKLPTLKSPVAPVVVGGGGGAATPGNGTGTTTPDSSGGTLVFPNETTRALTATAKISSLPATATKEQQVSFINECNKKPNSKSYYVITNSGEAPRCVSFGSGEASMYYQHCSSADCSKVYQNVIDECTKLKKGTYHPDSEVTSHGFCIYPG